MPHVRRRSGLWVPGIAASVPATAFTWNSADKGSAIVLANSDRDVTYDAAGFQAVRTTASKSSGSWYCEFTLKTQSGSSSSFGLGIADSGASMANYLGSSAISSMYYFSNSTTYTSGGGLANPGSLGTLTYAAGDIFAIAFDATNKKAWFGKNNTWITGDPAAATSPWLTWTSAFSVFIGATINQPNTAYMPISLAATLVYSPPSGFTALNA